LRVLADNSTVGPDQDGGIEAARATFFLNQLRIPEIKTDAEFLRFVEERLRFGGRNREFVELAVDFGLVFVPIARKKRRERELGKHHELRSHAVRVAQQFDQPLRGGSARVGKVQRAELGRGNSQVSRTHFKSSSNNWPQINADKRG